MKPVMMKVTGYKEFANILKRMSYGEILEFATNDESYGISCDPDNFTAWHYVKKVNDQEYDSQYYILDYCGGGEAYAIPSDEDLIEDFCKIYFESHCRDLSSKDDVVYFEFQKPSK